jgi:hypothetical protein
MNDKEKTFLERMISINNIIYYPTRNEAERNRSPGEIICYRNNNGMWFCMRLDIEQFLRNQLTPEEQDELMKRFKKNYRGRINEF